MIKLENNPALLLIDLQKGFDDITYWGGERNNPDAEENAARMLQQWRSLGLPVYHVQHCSTNPLSPLREGQTGNDFKSALTPLANEPVIKKNVNSAFIGTDLKALLDNAAICSLVIAGLTTDHCVSTTTRMAGNYGYTTFVVSDATATFRKIGVDGKAFPAELIHETALASLNNEFATVLSTEHILTGIAVNR
jgi:nicotinamidase-related amidase